jgi:hypothetical protein
MLQKCRFWRRASETTELSKLPDGDGVLLLRRGMNTGERVDKCRVRAFGATVAAILSGVAER